MNATRLAAIATLTLRDALRSRLLLSFVAVLVGGLLALPLLIEGDGTVIGRVHIIIRYSLGFAGLMLSVTTLWAACGGMAGEIEDGRIYLIATKPVRRHEIWLGKWLTIVLLDAGLLVVVGVMVAGMLAWTLRAAPRGSGPREEAYSQLLCARQPVPADVPVTDFDATVRARLAELLSSGTLPPGSDPANIEDELRRRLLRSAFVLQPGKPLALTFHLPAPHLPGGNAWLSFKALSSQPDYAPVITRWTFGQPEQEASRIVTNYPGIRWQQPVPSSAAAPDGTLTVLLSYEGLQNPGSLILAPDGEPPELLVPVGGFGMNLTRALLLLLCRLAFLAALGLGAGCLLSMPVAAFTAFFVLVILLSAGYVESISTLGAYYIPHEGGPLEQTWVDHLIIGMFRLLNLATAPVLQLDPIRLLAEGRLVGWHMVGRAIALLGVLYTALIAAVTMLLFRRRELA